MFISSNKSGHKKTLAQHGRHWRVVKQSGECCNYQDQGSRKRKMVKASEDVFSRSSSGFKGDDIMKIYRIWPREGNRDAAETLTISRELKYEFVLH